MRYFFNHDELAEAVELCIVDEVEGVAAAGASAEAVVIVSNDNHALVIDVASGAQLYTECYLN